MGDADKVVAVEVPFEEPTPVPGDASPTTEQALEVDDEATEEVPAEDLDEEGEVAAAARRGLPASTSGGAPSWAKIPKDNGQGKAFRFPRAAQVVFVRFKAELTRAPMKGDRSAILWELTDLDEKAALDRAMGDPNRAPSELSKQMIRAVDGVVPDWSGTPGTANIDQFWREIGARYRGQLIRIYTQMHLLQEEEQKDFFESCIAVRSTGGSTG